MNNPVFSPNIVGLFQAIQILALHGKEGKSPKLSLADLL